MIVICPSCDTRYTLTEDAVGEHGRNVRCRACGHTWFAKPPHLLEAETVAQDESGLTRAQVERLRQKAQANAQGRTGPHAEIREKERKRRQRNRMLAAAGAWTTSAVLFCGAAAATVVYREKVVEIWPKTASLFAMAGMEVNRFGLEFTDLEAQRSFDGTTPILTINGKVENVSDTHRPAPLVRIRLTSETGEVVHEEAVNLFDDVVAPASGSGFSARIISPPMESYQLAVDFEATGRAVDIEMHDAHLGADDHEASLDDEPHFDDAHEEDAHAVDDHAPAAPAGDSHDENAHGPDDADHGETHGMSHDDDHH